MNDEQVLGAVEAVRTAIRDRQPLVLPVRNAEARDARYQPSMKEPLTYYDQRPAEPGHLLWMCDQIPAFLQEGRREKAMRWLGFLQGALWVLRWRTVEAMKTDNAPEGTTIDKERV